MENKIFNHPYFGDMYYLVNIPEGLKDKENVPLLIFLHGAGERGRDFELIKKNAVPKLIKEGFEIPAITVCPQCPKDFIWNNYVFMLKDFIDFICDTYPINRERISLTGISMGGYGTWEMAMCFPDLFYKIAPVCGGGTPWRASLIKAKVQAYHGDLDKAVPPEASYQMVDAMLTSKLDAKLTIFHGVAHNSWDEAYGKTDLLSWILS